MKAKNNSIPGEKIEAFNLSKKNQKFATKANKKKEPNLIDPKMQKNHGIGTIIVAVFRAVAIIFIFTLLLISSGVYAYKNQFANKAFYGTKILGEDVGGKTKEEIQRIINKKVSQIEFSFNVDNQDFLVKPEEAGLIFNSGDSAARAVERGKSGDWYEPWQYAGASLFYKITPKVSAQSIGELASNNIEIDYQIDEAKLALFTESLSTKFNVESKNAGLVMSGSEVKVIPAVYGRKVVTDSIVLQIREGIRNANNPKVKIEVEKVNPAIIEDNTKESIEAASRLINLPVNYHYQGKNFTPTKATIGGWVVFNEQNVGGKTKLVPAVDANRVYGYVSEISKPFSVAAINKKVTIKNGAEQVVESEGKDGLAVDVKKASSSTAESLTAGRGVNLELPTYAIKSQTVVNNILVADWSKYIEINLSSQTAYAYEAGGKLVGSWRICSGKAGYATPTGTWLVTGKAYYIRMSGGYGTSEYYNLYPVKWVTWFKGGGYALHDAYWRNGSFGFPASHGCINLPDDGALFIYNWAPVGTPVVVHY